MVGVIPQLFDCRCLVNAVSYDNRTFSRKSVSGPS